MSGAPATALTTLDVIGEGFVSPSLDGAVCRFTPKDTGVPQFVSALQSVNSTLVRCAATPSTGVATAWIVSVLQNGVDAEPFLYSELAFTTYDLAQVRVSELLPPGGTTGPAGSTQTAVTVLGSGFAKYGEAQIACRVSGSTLVPGSQLVRGSLLDAQRIRCVLPAIGAAGVVTVTVSLSAGRAGTFSADAAPFTAYVPPYVAAVFPTEGDAKGGTLVTVTGLGFGALSTDPATRMSHLRCAFTTAAGPSASVQALSHSDTQVVCETSYGSGAQPVSIAMNSESFVSRPSADGTSGAQDGMATSAPTFTFVGLHPPSLVDVYFSIEGTTLVVRFDEQPTNRAGMNGIDLCENVLDDATVDTLKGSASAPPFCYWVDDSTLVVQLTVFTRAAGGMTVGIRPGVLWPKAWSHPGECSGVGSMCLLADSPGSSMMVDAYLPCDQRATVVRELCVMPAALIQAPNEIDSCPGTSVTLDASRSSGGGVRPLSYYWSAVPRSSDNYYQIAARLAVSGSVSMVKLGGDELDGGKDFRMILLVQSFLGASSPPYALTVRRAATPVPVVFIQAPPLLTFPFSAKVTLEARATTAKCFASNDSAVIFTWTHRASTVRAGTSNTYLPTPPRLCASPHSAPHVLHAFFAGQHEHGRPYTRRHVTSSTRPSAARLNTRCRRHVHVAGGRLHAIRFECLRLLRHESGAT